MNPNNSSTTPNSAASPVPLSLTQPLTTPAVDQFGPEGALILSRFQDLFAQAEDWRKKAATIHVTDETQVREMRLARETRLALRAIRIQVENSRKSLKEDIVRRGKAIDGVANVFKSVIEPIEEYLQAQEEFALRLEEERKRTLGATRSAELMALQFDHSCYDLANMAEAQFGTVKEIARRQKDERDAELKRQADAEKERQRLVELARVQQAEELKQAKAAAEVARKAQAEAEAAAKKERAEAEAAARKDRLEAEAKLAEARRQQAAVEAEERKKRQAAEAEAEKLRVAERNRLAALQQEEQKKKQAAEAAARASDEDKLVAYSLAVRAVAAKAPAVSSRTANHALAMAVVALNEVADRLEGAV